MRTLATIFGALALMTWGVSEARNPDTLKDFTRGVAAVSEQAANILD